MTAQALAEARKSPKKRLLWFVLKMVLKQHKETISSKNVALNVSQHSLWPSLTVSTNTHTHTFPAAGTVTLLTLLPGAPTVGQNTPPTNPATPSGRPPVYCPELPITRTDDCFLWPSGRDTTSTSPTTTTNTLGVQEAVVAKQPDTALEKKKKKLLEETR